MKNSYPVFIVVTRSFLTVKPRRIHKNVLYPVREVEGGGGGGGGGAPYERGAVARRKF